MESNYESDSGTDDDLPPSSYLRQQLSQQARACRQSIGTKRSGVGFIPVHCERFSAAEMEDDIQSLKALEMDAYTAVLRAFSAQSPSLTWTKERLMCDLRKELRISQEQHRQLTEQLEARQSATRDLSRRSVIPSESGPPPEINVSSLRSSSTSQKTAAFLAYRKTLKASHAHQGSQSVAPLQVPPAVSYPSYDIQSIDRSNSRIGKSRCKCCQPEAGPGAVIGHCASTSKAPVSLGGSTPSYHPNLQLLPVPGTGSTALNKVPMKSWSCEGSAAGRGKERKNLLSCHELLPAVPSSAVVKAPDTLRPFLGQKVQRLPDDKVFYDAVVVDYDQESGKHALVYDMETPTESYEWVKFKELMGKGEIKFVEGPPISLIGRSLEPPPTARGRGQGRNKGGGPEGLVGGGRDKSYSKFTPISSTSGLASAGSSPIKGNGAIGHGKTLRKLNSDSAAASAHHDEEYLKEIDLSKGKCPRLGATCKAVGVSVTDLNERGGISVSVPAIGDILEETKNLQEIDDLNTLADMKQKVDLVAEAFRTALHDLGDSSNEEDDDTEDIKSRDKRQDVKEKLEDPKSTQTDDTGLVAESEPISGDES